VLGIVLLALIAPALEGANGFVDLLALIALPGIGFVLGVRVTAELLAR
jgi:hypothetical protein